MKKIGLLTSETLADLIPDDSRLVSSGVGLALALEAVVWDRPQDWSRFDAVLVRSPWDYVQKKEQFVDVLRRIDQQSKLLNPLATMEWNFNKRYLLELQQRGLPVPRTVLLERTDPVTPLAHLGREVVIKPLVSNGGFETHRLAVADAQKFAWERLPWETHTFMAQEFLPSILTEGEYSLIFFGDTFSHCVRKTPRQDEFRVQDDHGGLVHAWTPTQAEIAEASAIIRALPMPFTYCRLDLARHPSGKLLIMEIELIEPELFFRFGDSAELRLLARVAADIP